MGSVQPASVGLRDLANESRDEAKSRLLTELKNLTPTGFEHFCLELLQQLGYRSVAVTRRGADGGIDGYGDFRQGAVSIKSAFQAKRWNDAPVRRPDIDKLRGAIQGDYDHGVFITTSRFTKDATQASYRKGAITILLLDAEAIAELMIERGIGVVKQPVYVYEIAPTSSTSKSRNNRAAYHALPTDALGATQRGRTACRDAGHRLIPSRIKALTDNIIPCIQMCRRRRSPQRE